MSLFFIYIPFFFSFLRKIMADVMNKTNLFSVSSYCNGYQNPQKFKTSAVAKSCRLPSDVNTVQSVRSQTTSFNSSFSGKRVVLQENQGKPKGWSFVKFSIKAQGGLRLKNSQQWWEKGLQPNMKEVTSAQGLVDSLLNAGDKLVVVDFFSPGCGGCKALHPKICQLAEMNPDVEFLHVNFEEHKSMCHSLNVHVLPFFRFYRGAQGRLCSFSCTNATIKKFKDALAKHTPDRCSLGSTKGLEEKELMALAANRDLKFTYTPESKPAPAEEETVPALAPSHSISTLPLPRPMTSLKIQDSEEKPLVASGR